MEPDRLLPPIEDYMTPLPLAMDSERPVAEANQLMTRAGIHHLPVIDRAEKLIGVVTDREVKVGLLFPGPGVLLLKDVITAPAYLVRSGTPLDDVVFEMMEHKHGCAVVADEQGKLVGIFTDTDALRALYELLGNIYRSAPSAPAA